MATGFVQRWKGKVSAIQLWLGNPAVQITASGTDINTLLGSGSTATHAITATATLTAFGAYNVSAATAIYVITLPTPVAGATLDFTLTSISSGVQFKSTAANIFAGSSGLVLKSTVALNFNMRATSSAIWGVQSVYNGSTSVIPIFALSSST